MNTLISFCGLNCQECPAYIATQANDQQAKERLLEKWQQEYNNPLMDINAVTCDGCTSKGRLGGYCNYCEIRACGVERGVDTCAGCSDYACEKLLKFFNIAPQARVNLESLRAA